MQKYKMPKYEHKDLGPNPFRETLIVPVNEVIYKNQFKEIGGLMTNVVAELEVTKYSRVYIPSKLRKIVSSLPSRAKELVLWIIYELESGQEEIWINRERYMKENKTSLNTYKAGLMEVLKSGILYQTLVNGVYWINPNYFWRGSRVNTFPKNVVKTKKEYPQPEEDND